MRKHEEYFCPLERDQVAEATTMAQDRWQTVTVPVYNQNQIQPRIMEDVANESIL